MVMVFMVKLNIMLIDYLIIVYTLYIISSRLTSKSLFHVVSFKREIYVELYIQIVK